MAEFILSEEAIREYAAAWTWYAERSKQAADNFESTFFETVQRIAEFPRTFPFIRHGGFRYALMPSFPYFIAFDAASEEIEIVSVVHTSRIPRDW